MIGTLRKYSEPVIELETLLAIRLLLKNTNGTLISIYPKRIAKVCYLKESPPYLLMIGNVLRVLSAMDLGLYRTSSRYRSIYLLPKRSPLANIISSSIVGLYELAKDIMNMSGSRYVRERYSTYRSETIFD